MMKVKEMIKLLSRLDGDDDFFVCGDEAIINVDVNGNVIADTEEIPDCHQISIDDKMGNYSISINRKYMIWGEITHCVKARSFVEACSIAMSKEDSVKDVIFNERTLERMTPPEALVVEQIETFIPDENEYDFDMRTVLKVEGRHAR